MTADVVPMVGHGDEPGLRWASLMERFDLVAGRAETE